jgi:hypothetical protein
MREGQRERILSTSIEQFLGYITGEKQNAYNMYIACYLCIRKCEPS